MDLSETTKMAESFNSGDVVMLKSGGPPLTVVDETANGLEFICMWFPKMDAPPLTDTFKPEVLQRVP